MRPWEDYAADAEAALAAAAEHDAKLATELGTRARQEAVVNSNLAIVALLAADV